MPIFRNRARSLVALATALLALSPARAQRQAPQKLDVPGPKMADAPYAVPAPGTKEIFTNFSNVITGRTDRWHVKFTSAAGRPGMRTGLFIPDNPSSPLTIDTTRLAQLWPLRVGTKVALEVQRYPRKWIWRIEVSGTERLKVAAGEFDTFLVTGTESQSLVTGNDKVSTMLYTFWYAPSINAVVRVRSLRTDGTEELFRSGAELLRLERPGKPSIGAAKPVAPKAKKP